MVTAIVSHEVRDFTEWKKGFDAEQPNRVKAGIKAVGLHRSIENPNEVVFIFEVPSAEIVKGMFANPDFQAALKKAGVIGSPIVKLLNQA